MGGMGLIMVWCYIAFFSETEARNLCPLEFLNLSPTSAAEVVVRRGSGAA